MNTVEVTAEMVQAAAEVRLRQYGSEYAASHLTWRDFADEAKEVLEAALATQQCGERTSAEAYTGSQGDLECVKWAGHRPPHVSKEGARWQPNACAPSPGN